MFTFITYEWKQWFRSPMLWIFLTIVAALIFGATSSDSVTVGGGVGSVHKNSPIVVQKYYQVMSLICLLMTTGFMSATANRDFNSGMYQFVFSSPIKKRNYFFGNFFGAVTISMIPLLGVSIGALLGPLMPWAEAGRYGDVVWSGHLWGILGIAIPNTLISGVLVYGLAVIFRNNLVSFVGAMMILVFYVVSGGYAGDIEQQWIANLLDPFGNRPFDYMTKYMTVDEQNTQSIALTGEFLTNRLVWLGVAAVLLAGIYSRFSFAAKKTRKRRGAEAEVEATAVEATPAIVPSKSFAAPKTTGFTWSGFIHMVGFEAKAIIRNQTFLIILAIGLINLIAALTTFTTSYGSSRYPVTYYVIDQIRGSFYLYLIGIITFYTGVVVWRERDAKISEIEDATSSSIGARFVSKLFAMIGALYLVSVSTIVIGIIVQFFNGYTRFELTQYATTVLLLDMAGFIFLTVVALFMHYVINNRYIAYFAFVAFVIVNSFIWSVLDIQSNMVDFGSTPSMTYSDMNGYGPFTSGQIWFNAYWLLASVLACFAAFAFAVRGKETAFKQRYPMAVRRLKRHAVSIGVVASLFLVCGGFVFYNTQMLNTYRTSDVQEEEQRDYELTYKKYENIAQPIWTDLTYHLNIYPEQRSIYVLVNASVINNTDESISEIHFTIPESMDSMTIEIPGASMKLSDERLFYRIYELESPLQPGESLALDVKAHNVTKGFENQVRFTSLTQNGTFLNNTDIMPMIGYMRRAEISDKNTREEYDLPQRDRMAKLDDLDMEARKRNYLDMDADYVNVRTLITTASDQIAVAPGSLVREWTEEDGRRGFEYQLDHQSLNFYSFITARYEVAREKWNGIDLEVYHIKEHSYNVPNMMNGMKKALDYYTTNFGPYYHKQCRIIEFPRYSSFAQAFPGTMPYSEGIGFITDLRDVDGEDIDFVFFVVAHEMAHQYWAHQLIGADMQGSEMMSESFAEYSALMVMEKEYGKDKMKKFLKYEMDQYLNGRSREFEQERPLAKVEGQPYIHYYKGSVVLFYLKEMIGEEAMNEAFASLIQDYGYRGAPYPTSRAAVRAFRKVTPDSLQYLIDDMFENITLFSNRVVDATYKKVGEQYEVTLTTSSSKMRSTGLGKESAVTLSDYMDIGVFVDDGDAADPGRQVYLERRHITKGDNTFTIMVDEKPDHVGIDPYNLLIDRLPDDNVKGVSEDTDVSVSGVGRGPGQ